MAYRKLPRHIKQFDLKVDFQFQLLKTNEVIFSLKLNMKWKKKFTCIKDYW